jgi:hypothetical protein
VKTNPRCDHKDGDRRCPDSAGYRIRQLTFDSYARYVLLPGCFCLKHAGRDRVPLDKLQPEHR